MYFHGCVYIKIYDYSTVIFVLLLYTCCTLTAVIPSSKFKFQELLVLLKKFPDFSQMDIARTKS